MRVVRTEPHPETWQHHLLIDLGATYNCVSSAAYRGGFTTTRYLLNRSVSKHWSCDNPVADTQTYLRNHKLELSGCVVLLTAVSVQDTQVVSVRKDDWVVHAFVTVGVGNAVRAGGRFALSDAGVVLPAAGTINIMVVIEGSLSRAALINAVQVITEAKVAALGACGVRTRFAEAATGTTTDAVAIVNAATAPVSAYGGLATTPGFLIGRAVYRAIIKHFKGAPDGR